MPKAKNKTAPTKIAPADFLKTIAHEGRRSDGEALLALFERVTGLAPQMWGPSIIGFGRYHYRYESGREGDAMLTGFSPRKSALTIYIMPGFEGKDAQLKRLGKHKLGKSCLYIGSLADIDVTVLEEMIADSLVTMRARYETFDA